jgi:hypothetical protein
MHLKNKIFRNKSKMSDENEDYEQAIDVEETRFVFQI